MVYGALVALAQTNFKRMIAYTSVNHMGYIVLAVGAAGILARGDTEARSLAITGAVTQMVSHGLLTGALFLLSGVLYDRGGTYDMDAYSGLAGPAPVFAGVTAVAAFASLGLPGLSGFIAEFQIFTGSLATAAVATAIAVTGILITAALFLRALQRIFTRPAAASRRWGHPSGVRRADRRRDRGHRAAARARGALSGSRHGSSWTSSSRPPAPSPTWWAGEPRNVGPLAPRDHPRGQRRRRAAGRVLAAPPPAMADPRAGRRRAPGRGLATAGLGAAGASTADFGTSYAIDTATSAVRIIVLAATLLIIGLSAGPFASHPRETEFYVLLLLVALGTIVLAGADDLLLLFAGVPARLHPRLRPRRIRQGPPGTEAALKYYLIGALLGIFMLAGITLLDGAAGTTSYTLLPAALTAAPHGTVTVGLIAVLAGLLFKAGGVPGHFWVPDVTEGTSAPVAALVTTVPKIGAFAGLLRLLTTAIPTSAVDWPLLAAVLAAATMTLGNLAAFYQTSVSRLLAYSTISQAGYLLMAIAAAARSTLATRSLLFYLAAYAATNLGAFAVVTDLPHAHPDQLPRPSPPSPWPGRCPPASAARHPAHRGVLRQTGGLHCHHRWRLRMAHRSGRGQHCRLAVLLSALAHARLPPPARRNPARPAARCGRLARSRRLHRRHHFPRVRHRRRRHPAAAHRNRAAIIAAQLQTTRGDIIASWRYKV